jgi:hypothetical protein
MIHAALLKLSVIASTMSKDRLAMPPCLLGMSRVSLQIGGLGRKYIREGYSLGFLDRFSMGACMPGAP